MEQLHCRVGRRGAPQQQQQPAPPTAGPWRRLALAGARGEKSIPNPFTSLACTPSCLATGLARPPASRDRALDLRQPACEIFQFMQLPPPL